MLVPLLIAHRGLVNGPDKNKENTLSAILSARNSGYDVEIDLWYKDNSWWLGHDEPQSKIDFDWLRLIDQVDYLDQHHAWIHAKSIQTLYQLRQIRWSGHVFFHENDPTVLTSSGYLWTFPGQELTPLSVCVMPEYTDAILQIKQLNVYAFCSDWIHRIESDLKR
jgi:hypothetical protein